MRDQKPHNLTGPQATYDAQQKTPEELRAGVEGFPQGNMLNCEYADINEIIRQWWEIYQNFRPHGTGANLRRTA